MLHITITKLTFYYNDNLNEIHKLHHQINLTGNKQNKVTQSITKKVLLMLIS